MEIQILSESGQVIAEIPVIPNLANVTREKALYYCGCLNALLTREMPCTRDYIHTTLKYIATLVGDVRAMRLIGPANALVGGVTLDEG